ncbi:mechanosensitive ion channel [Myxococcota bacterium]|nr:mechanosensitive ion channel [Myxococcota bacterium]MBU1380999.1 mechanosensitive ion channel [Myxococcota bacterium]MBU1496616.1 mechanosensitive ion channel [Myxococcota bacterium]
MWDNFKTAVEPLLPGFVMAAIFLVMLLALRLKFRGVPLIRKFKKPVTIIYVYFFLFILTVSSRMYAPAFFKILNLTSLIILTLAIVLSAAGAVFDIFLGHYRRISVPVIIKDIIILVVYIVVAVIVVGQQGVDVTSIVATSAVLTAVIGFALQDLLSSIISGLAIEIEKPFKVGDWVKFDQQEGRVLEINWRSTKIETRHLDTVIIPNNVVTRSAMINFSYPTELHRQRVEVGLPYGLPPNKAKASLLRALGGIDGILSDPAPIVNLKSYDDFSITYILMFYIDNYSRKEGLEDQVRTRMWYQLNRDGITIPFPIRDVNVRTVDKERENTLRSQMEAERSMILRHVPFLEPLDDNKINILANQLRSGFYGAGETIIHQGDEGSSFYIIASGRVDVRVKTPENTMKTVSSLHQYDFFGEMSLMTGERRKASIVSTEDTECYIIHKEVFRSIIEGSDSLVQAIGERLAHRSQELSTVEEQQQADIRDSLKPDATVSIVSRIKNFFQL